MYIIFFFFFRIDINDSKSFFIDSNIFKLTRVANNASRFMENGIFFITMAVGIVSCAPLLASLSL